jgi:hypothetical protein
MAKTKISEFSSTPANNTDIDSINIAEGCAPSGINDAIRELMAQLKDFQTGAAGDSFNGPVGTTTAAAGAFTTLAASGAVTLSGGTANGVAYLNGSKVLTTGSALVFDGTNLGIGTSSPGYKVDVVGATRVAETAAQNGYEVAPGSTNIVTSYNRTTAAWLTLRQRALSHEFYSNGTEAMRLDSVGNLGLGVTPSAWVSGETALQVGSLAALTSRSVGDGNRQVTLYNNSYVDSGSTFRYLISDAASFYRQNAGNHFWFRAPSGTAGNAISFTQAMVLDASGNLGIGTTTTYGRLTISSGASNDTRVHLQSNTSGGSINSGLLLALIASEGYVYNYANGPVIFGTNGTERARIDSSGNLLVGTTSAEVGGATRKFAVSSSGGFASAFVNTTAGNETVLVQNADTSGTRRFIVFKVNSGSGTSVGEISSNGTSTTYGTSSDYRLKNTIAPMTGALAKVALLKPCTYKWNVDGSDGEGFIAHELAEVCPQAVTGEKDAVDAEGKPKYQGIDTSFLVATLTAAIQELKADLDATKAELAALKGQP